MFWELESYENIIADQVNIYGYVNKDTIIAYYFALLDYFEEFRNAQQDLVARHDSIQKYLSDTEECRYDKTDFFIVITLRIILDATYKLFLKIKNGSDNVPLELVDKFFQRLNDVYIHF